LKNNEIILLAVVRLVCRIYTMHAETQERRANPRKRISQKATRRNISLPPALDAVAETVALKYGFATFSDYVQARIRKDHGGFELAA